MTKEEAYISKIIDETGLTRTEIQKLVDEKKEYLKGLISTEGALFIIARELGVEVPQKTKEITSIYIVDLQENMKNITVIGRIKRIYNTHEFLKKDGSEGKVKNFTIQDKTQWIRVVIWDNQVDEFSENELFTVNTLVKIVNGYMKWSDYNNAYEIHVARWGKIEFNPKVENREEYPEVEVVEDEF